MTLATRDHRSTPPSKARVTLTRTRLDTLRWLLSVASHPPRPRRKPKKKPAAASSRRVVLTRSSRDTFRWMLRATPGGIALTVLGVVSGIGAIVTLWMAVPMIDTFVSELLGWLTVAVRWVFDQLAALPSWLGSLF